MNNPQVKIGCVANLFSRMMHFKKAGDIELGHTHSFDHLTLLASGTLKVTANGKETVFEAPNMIYINKDVRHELVALEDNTVAYCIHALRDGNGVDDILDPEMIPNGVNLLSMASSLCVPNQQEYK
jgi:quercetin dioxygenase-like cupin family protein